MNPCPPRRAAPPIAAALFCLLTSSPALTLHVAPNGNDSWSGRPQQPNADRSDGPLASITGARNALRSIRKSTPLNEDVLIKIANGRYEITSPLTFEPEDGGTESHPVTYEAAPGATPLISGGRIVTGWQPAPDGTWETQIKDANPTWQFEQLWVNGHRATRARTPNTFWHHLAAVHEEPLDPATQNRPARARQTATVQPNDLLALTQLTPQELQKVHFIVYHNWDNTRRFIESIDPAKHTITTSGEGMKPWNPWKRNSTWIAENARQFLDTPGEWFLAPNGTLSYLPLPGQTPENTEVIAPVASHLLVLRGHSQQGRFVEHLHFRGIHFQHAQWLTPSSGFEPAQAAAPIDAAVMIDGARHVSIDQCAIGHTGTYAVWFREGCSQASLTSSELHDFGAGGVRIGETSQPANPAAQTSHITVHNNIIRHGGAIFPCAVGVWIGFSPHNRITHNDISDLFYTGISAGWRWGYGPSNCTHNTIAFNHVHHLGKGLLSDMGGIYTLGPSQGTTVTHNHFHHIDAYSYGGWGLYTDEGSTGITFENNLVHHTKTGSFHQHYGRENTIRNNIFVESRLHQLQATRIENHLSFTFENNLIAWTNDSPTFGGQWLKVTHQSRNNLYWNPNHPVRFGNFTLEEWQAAGHEQNSRVADPLFMDASNGDYRLQPDSPAIALGFKPFDPAQAGVEGPPEWRAKAASTTYPPTGNPPPPLP